MPIRFFRADTVQSMPVRRFRRAAPPAALLPVWALLAALPSGPAQASSIGMGIQFESWSDVDLGISTNPKRPSGKAAGWNHLNFELTGMTNYYVEEPGILLSLIAGMAQSEANEVNARNEAIRKGEHTYAWKYATPPPIPEGRWMRWGYTSGYQKGGHREYKTSALSNGKDSLVSRYDPTLIVNYHRYDANIVLAPRLIGKTDFYWMIGADISGTSVKIYDSQTNPGDDWSFMSTPINLHLGWQPRAFPYLMLEANGGLDLIDPVGQAILGMKNYTLPYSYGGRATLGLSWFGVYYTWFHQVESLYNYDAYSRAYVGNWSVFGARLDIGNLLFAMFGKK
jgi:hypothetical protein